MKKLAFALMITLLATGMSGCGSDSKSKGIAMMYNDLIYSSGRTFVAKLVIAGMTMEAWTGQWSSEASSEDCGGQKPATLYLENENYGTNSLTFECDKRNLYKVTISGSQVVIQYTDGGSTREAFSVTIPEGSKFSALSQQ
ncbi:MAG: hypothetical protein OEZ32_05980 [Nitrospinota bacterium]|nr:hypothetical protein [Nitrospinota bacterium]